MKLQLNNTIFINILATNIVLNNISLEWGVNIDDETLKMYARVHISSYRNKTVRSLKNDVKTPTEIAKATGIRRNHMSNVLRDLKETGIVECINEEVKRGRLYRLTPLGEEIAENLDDE